MPETMPLVASAALLSDALCVARRRVAGYIAALTTTGYLTPKEIAEARSLGTILMAFAAPFTLYPPGIEGKSEALVPWLVLRDAADLIEEVDAALMHDSPDGPPLSIAAAEMLIHVGALLAGGNAR